MLNTVRRHDIDTLRVLALLLLIVYHSAISFQPWAGSIAFPQAAKTLPGIWIWMAMLNVWRIPLLFLLSGMGVCYAMERRNWMQLLLERGRRILLPFLFCTYFSGAVLAELQNLFGWQEDYDLHFGHLWFLGNIFTYCLCTIGLLHYLKSCPEGALSTAFRRLLRWPPGLFLLALPFALEGWLLNPEIFEIYADNWHGFLLGLLCFLLGFLLITVRKVFWSVVAKRRWLLLGLAFALFLIRWLVFGLGAVPNALKGVESTYWMLAMLGIAAKYLNHPTELLSWCSQAVFPVYILHLPLQFLLSSFVLDLELAPAMQWILILAGTLSLSILVYEIVIRRLIWLRPLFGLR